jgi:hypothetical protein
MQKLPVLLIGFILIVAIALGGCGQESTNQTVDDAIQESQNVKSQHADFNLDLLVTGDFSSLGPQFQNLKEIRLGVAGGADVDNRDTENPKAKGNLRFEGLQQLLGSLIPPEGADAQTQMGINLLGSLLSDVEFVVVDKRAYVRLAGTWYDAGDASSLSELGGGLNLGGLNPGEAGANAQCYQDAMRDPSRFGADKLFSNLQEVGEETIDGADTRHLTADVDLDKTLTAAAEIARSCGDAEAAGGIEGGKQELISIFRTLAVEMWIDNDNNFRQVKLSIEIDGKAINLDANVKLSRFNEEFGITKPEGNIQKLEDLLGGLGSSLGVPGGTSAPGGMSGLEGLAGGA